MAEAAVHPPSAPRFFCHKCTEDISPVLPDYICPRCRLGFVEEVSQGSDESEDDVENSQDDAFHGHLFQLLTLAEVLRNADNSDSHNNSSNDTRPSGSGFPSGAMLNLAEIEVPILGRTRSARRARQNLSRSGAFDSPSSGWRTGPTSGTERLMHLLLTSLTEGRATAVGPGLPTNPELAYNNPIFFTLHGNPGDYAWGRGNFDAIITHLLNQLDGTGPPPLPKDKIHEIPTVAINSDQVEKNLQCTVCMEDFKVAEPVRRLKCDHHFHTGCITPWLELHGTCPICRCTLHEQDGPVPMDTNPPPSSGPSTSSQQSNYPSAYEYPEDFD